MCILTVAVVVEHRLTSKTFYTDVRSPNTLYLTMHGVFTSMETDDGYIMPDFGSVRLSTR